MLCIVQDLGVFAALSRQKFSGTASFMQVRRWQLPAPKGMKFLEEQGVSRVVAARELDSSGAVQPCIRQSPIEI
ncbi:MAG: U32 family peptidase [Blautia caecimuris]